MKQIKIGAITYAQLIKHMLPGIYSCTELAEITGLHVVTVYQYTRELHAAGAAHISSWEKDGWGRDKIKVYKIGPGQDAERHSLTRAQKNERYRDKRSHQRMIERTAA